MRYEEITNYLNDHSIIELSDHFGIPIPTLYRYLKRHGYTPVISDGYLIKNNELISDIDFGPKINSIAAGLVLSGACMGEHSMSITKSWSEIVGVLCAYMMLRPYSVGIKAVSGDKLLYECSLLFEGSPWDAIGPEGIGIWCMLSGARYGTGFLIHIPPMHMNRLQDNVMMLNQKYRWDFKIGKNFIYVPAGSSAVRVASPYIHEHYFHRIGVSADKCGMWIKEQPWYDELEKIRIKAVHPFIKRVPFTGAMYRAFDDEQKKKYLAAVFDQVRVRGFPYVLITDKDRENLFENMKRSTTKVDDDNYLKYNNSCNALPNSFMNHRYKLRVKKELSPLEVFSDDRLLKKVLHIQLRGDTDIKDSNIRGALSTYGTQAVGQFNPLFAKFFCDLYCIPGGLVIDPCAGFGSRLCGCISSGRRYRGIDPSTETYTALKEMILWFEKRGILGNIVRQGCGEDPELYQDVQADMAITSPPYFDREEYSYEDTQSFKKYPSIEGWLKSFLTPLIENVYSVLKPMCVFVLNIDDVEKSDIIDPSVKIAKDIGFLLEKTYYSNILTRPGTKKKSIEPYFVFRKGH